VIETINIAVVCIKNRPDLWITIENSLDVPDLENNMFCSVLRAYIHVRVSGVDITLIFYSVTCDGGSLIFIRWGEYGCVCGY
jgi:hypothetical protein